jgi:hypothetical protein
VRTQLSGTPGCLAISQDHHHAIVVLLDHSLFASSFALLGCEFEAYVRGQWLALCATDHEVKAFSNAEKPAEIGKMLEALEATPAFSEKIISRIKANSWRAMCAYTHTGELHVQRWGTDDATEPNYEVGEIQEVLSFAETFGALAVIGVACLANADKIAEDVLNKFIERTGNES